MSESMITIEIDWDGPHAFGNPKAFDPPSQPGVYLWTIGGPKQRQVSYVGETDNIRRRLYEHAVQILGGGYWLYKPQKMCQGRHIWRYKSGSDSFFNEFVAKIEEMMKLSRENLFAYEFFWAVIDADSRTRKAVESAIIDAARNLKIQNSGRSIGPENCPPITLRSNFQHSIIVKGIASVIIYPPTVY